MSAGGMGTGKKSAVLTKRNALNGKRLVGNYAVTFVCMYVRM